MRRRLELELDRKQCPSAGPGLRPDCLGRNPIAFVIVNFEHPLVGPAPGGTFDTGFYGEGPTARDCCRHIPDDYASLMACVSHTAAFKPIRRSGYRLLSSMGTSDIAVHMSFTQAMLAESTDRLTAGIQTRNGLALHVDNLVFAVAA